MRAVDQCPRRGRAVRTAFVAAAVGLAFAAPSNCAADSSHGRSRLVLQITVDQLRGDLALRGRDRWGKGGFRRLYERGAVFSDAHHGHANTETIVGHATLATGADPSVHGMVGNVWFDRKSGELHYNIEDSRYNLVGSEVLGSGGASAGHAEVAKAVRGRSPAAILAPSIADSIAEAGGGKAKIFAVSLKDRAAVPMAGRTGRALWWSDASGDFISSTFYYPRSQLPAWARHWNDARSVDHIDGRAWTLLLEPPTYRYAARDDAPWEIPPPGMERTFPHRFDRARLGEGFYAAVEASPFGDELLVDFVRALLRAEDLGHDEVVDYLSVALSATDFIGHRYGPDSLEIEDAVLRLDRQVEALLDAVDDAAGHGRTLVVLSSDHGVAQPPAQLIGQGKSAGRVVLSAIEKSAGMQKVAKKFGGLYIRQQWPPYIYLDNDAIARKKLDLETVARALAAEIARAEGVEAAWTRGQIMSGELPDTDAARAVRRSFHPDRSGDIHVVPRPGWQIAFEIPSASQFATGHGTPWRYDTFVPLIFQGPGVARVEVGRRVEAIDVAPTIAALLGIAAPARASGQVLVEAVAK